MRNPTASIRPCKSIALALLLHAHIVWAAAAIDEWERSARQVDEDVEFYHDCGGELIGKSALAAANQGMVGAPGVPKPAGQPGHSTENDFNTMQCRAPMCDQR